MGCLFLQGFLVAKGVSERLLVGSAGLPSFVRGFRARLLGLLVTYRVSAVVTVLLAFGGWFACGFENCFLVFKIGCCRRF